MNCFSKTFGFLGLFILGACGGGDPTIVTKGAGAGGGGGTIFNDVLALSASESSGIAGYGDDALVTFGAFNTLPSVTPSSLPALVDYSGNLVARVGNTSTFFESQYNLRMDFANGSGTGSLRLAGFTGPAPVDARKLNALNTGRITVTNVNGSSFQGQISGDFEEDFSLVTPRPADTFSVSAVLDAEVVDSDPSTLLTEMVGTLDGTITSNLKGQETLVGVIAGSGLPSAGF